MRSSIGSNELSIESTDVVISYIMHVYVCVRILEKLKDTSKLYTVSLVTWPCTGAQLQVTCIANCMYVCIYV